MKDRNNLLHINIFIYLIDENKDEIIYLFLINKIN
jgi:hypothetical protein